jgi:hypothetical protein
MLLENYADSAAQWATADPNALEVAESQDAGFICI